MNKKKTIMLIPPIGLPVPAIGGGAVEQLITHLLDVNEIENKVNIVVISKYDEQAAECKYKHSKVYYYRTDTQKFDGIPLAKARWKLYRLWLKIFQNRFTYRLFPKHITRIEECYTFQLYQIAKHEKADYIILEGGWNWTNYAILNELLGRELLFTHIHASTAEDMWIRRVIHNSISISAYVRDMWVKDNSIPGTNVVLYNGIDVRKFQFPISREMRSMKRKQIGVLDDECLVLYCGRIIPEKGIKELLDAFDLLSGEKIKLLLIGNVGFSANQSTEFSIKISNKTKNNQNVISLGYIPNDQLPEYYALADIQVIPSICQEGAGLVAVEGMAAGLPLIVTQSGGMVEYVDSNAAIQVSIDGDLSQNLALNIKLLANDEVRRGKMGNAGRQRAKLFSRENYYKNFVDIFENLQYK